VAKGAPVLRFETPGEGVIRRSSRSADGALELPLARLVLYAAPDAVTAALERELAASRRVLLAGVVSSAAGLAATAREAPRLDLVVYRPGYRSARDSRPDLDQAAAVLEVCVRIGAVRLILLSSAAFCQPLHTHPGLLPEDRCKALSNPIALSWQELESRCAKRCAAAGMELSVLRPAAVVSNDGIDYFSRLLRGSLAPTLAGHDPCLQLLSPADLAAALRSLVERPASGVFHVAPASVIPLSAALRLAGVRRLPIAYTVQRAARRITAPLGLSFPSAQLAYVRYAATVSGARLERELGFVPRRSSAGAIRSLVEARGLAVAPAARDRYDDFGMDTGYIAALGRTLFHFLHRYYWRVEVRGLEHVPGEGGAVLAGVHRGFMPFDGVMALHTLARERGRLPRFLVHPSLLKPPFLATFISRLGGIPACRENADRVLGAGELLGMFPEGIQGAFTLYRHAYRLRRFGRDEYVKMALRNGVPIVPFVTVGSAEIFPILGKVEWRWWQRVSEWPFLPLTPTFPLLPLPLPSKWHTRFLPPLEVQRLHAPAAAADPAVVRALSREVRRRMEAAIGEMLARRRSIFFGSVFETAAAGAASPQEAR
jgi:1-acyl-sn-glycerol-3-phosphate acyltransferase/nucleoside-diphosphate-sugar epimerase